jgi:osmotically-inducible protein OsmY
VLPDIIARHGHGFREGAFHHGLTNTNRRWQPTQWMLTARHALRNLLRRRLSMMTSDHEIHQRVIEALRYDPRVDETEVGVEVDGGVVTLTGTVTDSIKKTAAEEAAHRARGVLDVVNHVETRPATASYVSDVDIAHEVRHALRSVVPRVADTQICSTVAQGRVTLEGDVDTRYERDAVVHAIGTLLGVRGVENRLEVGQPVSAQALHEQIERSLERRAERQADDIHVEVRGGLVKLTGVVYSRAEREAILGVVRDTRGVREIEDELVSRFDTT